MTFKKIKRQMSNEDIQHYWKVSKRPSKELRMNLVIFTKRYFGIFKGISKKLVKVNKNFLQLDLTQDIFGMTLCWHASHSWKYRSWNRIID